MKNVIAKAIGKYKLGFALGTAILIAAGTSIYEALAANMANKSLLPSLSVNIELTIATIQPLIIGITIAKIKANHLFLRKQIIFYR